MNNGLGSNRNTIPEVYAGANNKKIQNQKKHLNKNTLYKNLKLIILILVRIKITDKLIY